jgi:hypothetical protein
MNRDPRLAGLCTIAAALRDVELSQMNRIQARIAALHQRMEGLNRPQLDMDSPDLIVEAMAAQSYDAWADLRRREIMADRARLEQERLSRRKAVSLALGRHNALEKLREG